MSQKRGFLLATLFVSSLGLWTGWAEDGDPALPGRDRYLLLDSRIVAGTENAQLVLGEVQKYEGNPLFEEDKPWEKRFDNLYANVTYDEEEEIYKCWYSPFIVDESAKGMTLQEHLLCHVGGRHHLGQTRAGARRIRGEHGKQHPVAGQRPPEQRQRRALGGAPR